MSISCFSIDMKYISKIWEILLDGSSSFSGARLFEKCQHFGSPNMFLKMFKGFLFDSKSCGQCSLGSTGMACPMNCPKTLRNGPCGGVRSDGTCEIDAEMICVWITAWEGSQRINNGEEAIQIIQPPVDARLQGSSAWLKMLRDKVRGKKGVVDSAI